MQNPQDVQRAALALQEALGQPLAPNVIGLVLGTGLSDLAAGLEPLGAPVSFRDIPGFPHSSVPSHAGEFRLLGGAGFQLLAQCGRCHLYEGRSPAEVCMGVRLMRQLGARKLIITNAAGALNPLFEPGGLMLMTDMINHTGASPLTGPNHEEWGERFPDMSAPFERRFIEMARRHAASMGLGLERGVYIGVRGPEMETAAETRAYRLMGGDAIGMSTVLEVIAARHMGMAVLGLSCLTNKNLPDAMKPAPLAEVLAMAAKAGQKLALLLPGLCEKLAHA